MTTDYKELAVWKQSRELVKEIYQATRALPREETFGLTSQMRRAAVSISSNIAEGKGRYSQKELVQFLYKSRGSLTELETQIYIANDLDYIDETNKKNLLSKLTRVNQLLNGLIRRFQGEIHFREQSGDR